MGEDDIYRQPFPHANFHLPEIVGNARAYELTANATDAAVVHTFFNALTLNHSYCTGGSNSGECWQKSARRRSTPFAAGGRARHLLLMSPLTVTLCGRPCARCSSSRVDSPRDLAAFLSTQTEESCTQVGCLAGIDRTQPAPGSCA